MSLLAGTNKCKQTTGTRAGCTSPNTTKSSEERLLFLLASSAANFPRRYAHQVQRTGHPKPCLYSPTHHVWPLVLRGVPTCLFNSVARMANARSVFLTGTLALRAESYETSGATFNYGKKVPFATKTFLYPLALSPVDTQTNGFICSSDGELCIQVVIRVLQQFWLLRQYLQTLLLVFCISAFKSTSSAS